MAASAGPKSFSKISMMSTASVQTLHWNQRTFFCQKYNEIKIQENTYYTYFSNSYNNGNQIGDWKVEPQFWFQNVWRMKHFLGRRRDFLEISIISPVACLTWPGNWKGRAFNCWRCGLAADKPTKATAKTSRTFMMRCGLDEHESDAPNVITYPFYTQWNNQKILSIAASL